MSRLSPSLPATSVHVPHVNHSHATPTWSGVFSQLKSLVLRSPLISATVAVATVAGVAFAFVSAEQERRRLQERRRILRLVKGQFDTRRLDIIKYIWEASWNKFDIAQLEAIYSAFIALLSNPKRGVLPLSSLAGIIRAAGVVDDRVALSCAKFFDADANCQIDFIEFVQRLDLACFGSAQAKLECLFSVYDLDNSGKISREEMEEVFAALQHGRSKEQRHEAVQAFFKCADQDWDGQISKKEFLALAEQEGSISFPFFPTVATHFKLQLQQ